MKNTTSFIYTVIFALISTSALAGTNMYLVPRDLLSEAKISRAASLSENWAAVPLNDFERDRIVRLTHEKGRCGGLIQVEQNNNFEQMIANLEGDAQSANSSVFLERNAEYAAAAAELMPQEIENYTRNLVAYGSRSARLTDPNRHVNDLVTLLRTFTTADYVTVELVDHSRLNQKSVRARITGSQYPNEIVVIGGHLDSTTMFSATNAPGADDNASGSANVLQAFRKIVSMGQPKRTIEFFWYAGEELGLVGSAEIARNYASQQKRVVGALQLDMTLYPGNGRRNMFVFTGNTSPSLSGFVRDILTTYLPVTVGTSSCGYACSDHASWDANGYASAYVGESDMQSYNRRIHTAQDIIADDRSDFEHSIEYSRLALLFGLELANSRWNP